ncbi:MAG TPA: fimbria/pilus periplasmic chaperone [Thermoanaerobaculia bacterium]|nr:fimbria/pilus periplasmic chaperone [Thermoanaerobaculia bacterium]
MVLQRVLRGFAVCILGLLSWGAGDVQAASFTVTPVRIFLGAGSTSALLTVRNDSTEPIRFQISLRAWNQAADGDMQLSDTNDLVFFPALMELKPAEEKKVRVGSAFKAPVATERSYRIFFEELPPPQVSTPATTSGLGAQVRVLTKMGVPIFVQPPNPVVKGELANVSIANRTVSFDVRNVGNSFFTVNGATVTGISKAGATTFTKQQDGWYVLAGGTRHFVFEIPADACAGTERIKVDVTSSIGDEKGNPSSLNREAAVGADACTAASVK